MEDECKHEHEDWGGNRVWVYECWTYVCKGTEMGMVSQEAVYGVCTLCVGERGESVMGCFGVSEMW